MGHGTLTHFTVLMIYGYKDTVFSANLFYFPLFIYLFYIHRVMWTGSCPPYLFGFVSQYADGLVEFSKNCL